MTDLASLPAPGAPVQPPATSAAPVAPPSQGAPSVHVHLSPELLRMAGLPAQAATPAAPPAAQAAQVTQAAEPPKAPAAEAPKPADAPDAAKALAEVSALRAQLRATAIRGEVERVCLKGNAINIDVVHKLVADRLDATDDGKVLAKGDPTVTGEQLVARFLTDNPFLLKPMVPGGGSGAPSNVVPIAGVAPLNLNDNASVTAHANARAKAMGFAR